ncbi:MAG: hypothetical protein QXS32_08440 [Candidatus Nezhaarchaeales archaeon]
MSVLHELDAGWPWPLDGVQRWFESFWNSISSWVWSAASWIYSQMSSFFSSLSSTVWSGLNWAWSQIQSALSTLRDWTWSGLQWVWNQVKAALDSFRGWVQGAVQWIVEQLKPLFPLIKDWIYEGARWLYGSLSSFASNVNSAFWSGVYWLRDQVYSMFDGAARSIIENLLRPLKDFFSWIWSSLASLAAQVSAFLQEHVVTPIYNALSWLFNRIVDFFRSAFNALVGALKGVCEAIEKGDLSSLWSLLATFGAVGLGATAISCVGSIKILGSGVDLGEVASYVKDLFNPSMLSGLLTGVALGIAVRAPLEQYYRSIFRTTLPSIGDVRSWWSLNLIDDKIAADILAKHGFRDEYVKNMIESWYAVPSLRDLQEALWRGLISPDEYRKYLALYNYRTEPRKGFTTKELDLMYELSFRLPSWREVRRMLRWGLLTEDEFKQLMMADGLHPKYVDKVVQGEWLDLLQDERSALRTAYIRLFRLGLMSEEELRARLKACYFSDREVDFTIARAKIEYEIELLEEKIAAAKEAYRKDLLTDEELFNMLISWGVDPRRARLIVDHESFKKLPRPRYK